MPLGRHNQNLVTTVQESEPKKWCMSVVTGNEFISEFGFISDPDGRDVLELLKSIGQKEPGAGTML